MDTEARPTAAGSPAPAAAAREAQPTEWEGIDIHLIPDEVELELRAVPADPRTEWQRPMWHHVRPRPDASVLIGSRSDRQHAVRLSVQSAAPGWRARWVRWSYAARRVPDDAGGAALSAQDRLDAEDTGLTLLVLPGEQRSASLEFEAALDGETAPGDYPFLVTVKDEAGAGATTRPGLLRLRHPGANLLGYLPSIYNTAPRADARQRFVPFEDAPFFPRFLRGFEDAMEPLQALVANLYRYFDSESSPADFLPWLSTWVALVLDENWPVMRRRRLISEAVELYRWRGTRRGLSRYLQIYTGAVPRISDQPFEGMRLGSNTLLGRETILGDVPPHTFVVTLAVPDPRTINEQVVRDIVESEKPAHTAYALRIVQRAAGEN